MTSFHVGGLLREPAGSVRDVHLRDHYVALGPDVELAGPLDADLRLQRTNRGIIARGTVRAPLRRTCSRCLDPFVEDAEAAVEEEFLPTRGPGQRRPTRDRCRGRRGAAHRRPPRDRPGAGAPRRAGPHRADAPALPAGLPGALRGVRRLASPTGRTITASRRSIRASPAWPGCSTTAARAAVGPGRPLASPRRRRYTSASPHRRVAEHNAAQESPWAFPSERYPRPARVSVALISRSARRPSWSATTATS